jgi:hypothetical protein
MVFSRPWVLKKMKCWFLADYFCWFLSRLFSAKVRFLGKVSDWFSYQLLPFFGGFALPKGSAERKKTGANKA